MAAKDKPTEEPRKLDEAPQAGGVYIKDGRVVDAEGNELEGWAVDSDGNAVKMNAPSNAPSAEGK